MISRVCVLHSIFQIIDFDSFYFVHSWQTGTETMVSWHSQHISSSYICDVVFCGIRSVSLYIKDYILKVKIATTVIWDNTSLLGSIADLKQNSFDFFETLSSCLKILLANANKEMFLKKCFAGNWKLSNHSDRVWFGGQNSRENILKKKVYIGDTSHTH